MVLSRKYRVCVSVLEIQILWFCLLEIQTLLFCLGNTEFVVLSFGSTEFVVLSWKYRVYGSVLEI